MGRGPGTASKKASAPSDYKVQIGDRARRQLDDLPDEDIARLLDAIDDLAKNPRPPGSKKLAARDGYRIRKGQYRVLYTVDDTVRIVFVYQVGNRRDVYRR